MVKIDEGSVYKSLKKIKSTRLQTDLLKLAFMPLKILHSLVFEIDTKEYVL